MTRTMRCTGLFVMCLTAFFLAEAACQAAPRVRVDQPVYDAGTVSEGIEVIHEFVFRNAGDRDLVIKPKPC